MTDYDNDHHATILWQSMIAIIIQQFMTVCDNHHHTTVYDSLYSNTLLWSSNSLLCSSNLLLWNRNFLLWNRNLLLWNSNTLLWNSNTLLWNSNTLLSLWEIMMRSLNNVAFLQSSTYLLRNVEPYVQPYFIFKNIYAIICNKFLSTHFFNNYATILQYCKLLKNYCKLWSTQK